MKKIYIAINLAVIFLIFFLGNEMTTTPGHSSGNGNPAILLSVPLLICFIILVIHWFYLLKDKRFNIRTIFMMVLIVIIHFTIGVYYQIISYRNYREFLAQVYAEQYGSVDWEYINSITTGFSIHINNQFYNWNTCLLFLSLSFFIWLISYLLNR